MSIIILLIISAVFMSQQERISLKWDTWFSGPYWNCNNWFYQNPVIQLIMRYPLSMFKDGWHICKFLSLVSLLIAIVISGNQPWYYVIYYYVLTGLVFNLFYHYL